VGGIQRCRPSEPERLTTSKTGGPMWLKGMPPRSGNRARPSRPAASLTTSGEQGDAAHGRGRWARAEVLPSQSVIKPTRWNHEDNNLGGWGGFFFFFFFFFPGNQRVAA